MVRAAAANYWAKGADGLIVALEPVWNREARAVAARAAVGCGQRATERPHVALTRARRAAARPLSPCHELQAA